VLLFRQRRLLQIGGNADNRVNQRGRCGDAQRRAHFPLQIEMLWINPDRGKPSEHAARAATDGRRNDALYPKFKLLKFDSLHALGHRNKGLLVERGDGVVEFVVSPRIVGAIFAAFAIVDRTSLPGARSAA
jgi:hypothetical protein